MKNTVYALMAIAFLISCSSFSTKTEMRERRAIGKIKRAGLIYRVSTHSRIAAADYTRNFTHWLNACGSPKKVVLIPECGPELSSYAGDDDRFYQISDTGRYQNFKAAGVINTYLSKNDAELKKLIAENKLDAVIVYEVYPIVSLEMQFIEFESVLMVMDNNLKRIYLDHQADSLESDEMSFEKMKLHVLDKISRRLIETLEDLNLATR